MTDAGSDREELMGYVEVWKQAVDDFVALMDSIPEEQWSTPTDLPGWDVRALASHTAHLEAILAGGPEEEADLGDPLPGHVTGLGLYTEIGVHNRREVAKHDILAEIREATATRYAALQADPPTDADAVPERTFAGVPWSWRTLLRNRPLDIWMHEQDARRAVGAPGGMDTAPAKHTADYLAESLGFVLAKKVGAEPGTTLVLEMTGSAPFAFAVTDARRGERLTEVPADPTVTVATDRESFICLAGGRRVLDRLDHPEHAFTISGDQALGEQVVAAMATTP